VRRGCATLVPLLQSLYFRQKIPSERFTHVCDCGESLIHVSHGKECDFLSAKRICTKAGKVTVGLASDVTYCVGY